jgi:RNA polymerase sigma-70 factor (ECF subfamily)
MCGQTLSYRGLLPIVNEDAWRQIYDEMLPRVFHYFAYRLGDTQTAEDLAATTFEKAWKARRQFRRDKGRVDQWVFGIARRVLVDHHRQQRPVVDSDPRPTEASDFSVEGVVSQNHRFKRLAGLLEGLPERTRELISLKYGAGFNNRQIASITGLSESNVGTILHRAVQDLRTRWDENE